MKHALIGLFFVMLPTLSYAEGSCSYVAYKNCYAVNPMSRPTDAMIRAMCMVNSTQTEGVYGAEDFAECKQIANSLGQMVAIDFYDYDTETHTKLRVYPH